MRLFIYVHGYTRARLTDLNSDDLPIPSSLIDPSITTATTTTKRHLRKYIHT